MSALSPKADSCGAATDVGYGPIAGIETLADRINSLDICISSSRILLQPSWRGGL